MRNPGASVLARHAISGRWRDESLPGKLEEAETAVTGPLRFPIAMRADAIRAEIIRMLHQAPFRPFVLSMENGDRVTIGHPENIAFDPEGESPDFYVISGRVRLFGTFDAVSSVATADSVEHLA